MVKSKKQKKMQKKKSSKYTTHSCEMCEDIDCDEMVCCDTCELWYHFVCVGLVSIGHDDPWNCPPCIESKKNKSFSGQNKRRSRQPPAKETKTNNKRHPCQLCSNIDNAAMAQCDVCDLKFHLECIGITSVEDPWMCQQCEEDQSRLERLAANKSRSSSDKKVNTSNPEVNKNSRSVNVQSQDTHVNGERSDREQENQSQTRSNDNSTRHSKTTRSSIRRKTQLELDRIQEERQLREKRDNEYLDSKYRVLLEDCSSESDRRSTDRSSFTRSWVQSTQANPPSIEKHHAVSLSANSKIVESKANQQEKGANPDRILSSSADKLNHRLWLDHRRYFVKKLDQMQLDDADQKNHEQTDKRVGLSANTTAPAKLNEPPTVPNRHSCPEHDAKLHMFRSQEPKLIAGCSARTNGSNQNINEVKPYEWSEREIQIQELIELQDPRLPLKDRMEFARIMFETQRMRVPNNQLHEETNAQPSSSCRQENPEEVEMLPQKANLPKQSQIHNDGLDLDKNHQSDFKELTFVKCRGTDQWMRDRRPDTNDCYRRMDGEGQDFRNKKPPFENATAQEMCWEQRPLKDNPYSLVDHPAKSINGLKSEPRDVYGRPSLEHSWNPRSNNLENQKEPIHNQKHGNNQKHSNRWPDPDSQNLKNSSPISEFKSSKNPEPAPRDSEYQRQRHEHTRHEGSQNTGDDQQQGIDGRRNYGFTNCSHSENCQAPQNQIQQNTFENLRDREKSENTNTGCRPKLYESIESMPNFTENLSLTRNQIAARHIIDKKLPIFAGNPDEWPLWYGEVKSSTAKCGFDNAENLSRFKHSLKGKARDMVRSRLGRADSVPWILSTLEMLYGRPEVLIRTAINKVREFPTIRADNIDTLMEFAFEVQNISVTIESLNLENYMSDPMLVEELVNKLPTQEKKDWARFKMGKSNVNIKTLATWLYELAQVLSTVVTPKATSSDRHIKSTSSERNPQQRDGKESARVNVHVASNSKQHELVNSYNVQQQAKSPKKAFPCTVCNKGCEKVENCPTFKSYTTECRWKAVIDHKLCRKCMRKHKFPCKATSTCERSGCQYKEKHHSLLHNDERHSSISKVNENITVVPNNFHNVKNEGTMLKLIPVVLHHGNRSVKTFAFLDDGTTISMMERNIANELGLNGTPEQLCLLWTKKIHRKEMAERVTAKISGLNEFDRQYDIRGIRTVNDLHLPIQSMNKEDLAERYPYLKDVPLINYENAKPGIIIGSDMPKFGTHWKVVEGPEDNSPIALKTRLGWTIHGPRGASTNYQHANYHQVEICPHHNELDNEIHQRVKEYFSIENFGVQVNNKFDTESIENQRALDLLRKFTKKIDGKYETGLLWKDDSVRIPDSYAMAMKRLISLEKQGDKVINAIGEKIADYVSKNYARILTAEELKVDRPSWYLPVFGVTHPKKPDKLRMVFDAAARVKNVSLNSMLLKGPDQLTSIVDILRRFREKYIAVCGDIKEMFHQIRIREGDQHFQRFLFRNGERQRKPDVYIMQAMTFGATCSPCTAQYVKNLNASEFKVTKPRAVKAIIDNHYVDDMMDGADTEEEAIKLVLDIKTIHAEGGFEIRNFLSNSKKVREAISGDGGCDGKDIMPNSELKTERVLGMWWDMKKDVFTFSLKYTLINEEILNGKRLPTKREVLRTVMSIFDPLGLLSNYLVHLKMLLQEIWRAEIDWDEQIATDNLVEQWKRWLEILPRVENVRIPRLYSPKLASRTPKSMQLHVFVDASQDAFSAVIYLRIEDENGVDCALVGSKSKVAPLKYLSIPRLELQAAVLGTRLVTSIGNGQRLKIDRRIIWSDSETVLSWINSNHRKYSQFVAHRVGEILESSDVNEWRWIPTKENVADEATKWMKPPTFESSNRWFSGPEFVRLNEDHWPKKKKIIIDCEEEMKAHFAHSALVIPQLIDPTRFSKWNRMVRAVAYVFRFGRKSGSPKGPITQEELTKAENVIFRQAQFESYPSEMVILERNETLPIDQRVFIEKPSPLYDGTPFLDAEGVLRMKTRIDGARDLSMDTKRPIILPKNSRITQLMVHHYHVRYFHQNHQTVLNEIRQKFYISCARIVLNKVRNRCQMCKVKLAHVMEPQMADLPPARLASGFRPFSYVGVDYFGPMYVMIGRRKEKRWGVLFTCLTIRAIHIEIAPSLNTNSCILCIGNFVAEHGCVIEFHSDCGTNFKGSDNELKREMEKINKDELQTKFTTRYTKWIFNPPTASHMGGSWERLIRSVKSGINQIMATKTPQEETLRNILKEIQSVVNSRPLTFIPLDMEEDEALTPNHFLLGSSNGNKPPCKIELDGPYLRKSWKEAQRLTELFWKRFVIEYLPTLARRTKWLKPVKPIQPGDLVLVVDEDNPRNTYPKARVVETKVSSNGQVRRARVELILAVKTQSNGKICKVVKSDLWKPAHKLAVLDVAPTKEDGLAQPGLERETGGSVGAAEIKPQDGTIGHHTGQIDSMNLSTGEVSNVKNQKEEVREKSQRPQ